jgi:hypothetical protein
MEIFPEILRKYLFVVTDSIADERLMVLKKAEFLVARLTKLENRNILLR